MARLFNPGKVIRQLSNNLLRRFWEDRDCNLPEDCAALTGTNLKEVQYRLNHLVRPGFKFEFESGDNLEDVRLRRIRFSVLGDSPRRTITMEADPGGKADDIEKMIATHMKNLPYASLDVKSATISIRLFPNGIKRASAFEFTVSTPNTCTMKSQREEFRLLCEKYLRKWKIHASTGA